MVHFLIVRAWYSALRLEIEDCRELVHFPENCRYVLNVNAPDFDIIYNDLLFRLDYLAKSSIIVVTFPTRGKQ